MRTCFNQREAEGKYSGIDLHSNNSVVSVTDEEDRVVTEKRLPNDLAKIIGLLMPWRDELAGVVVESTFNWYWLVDGLQAAGFKVHLANTTAIKKYDGLKHSGDEFDARYLAHLLRLGILPTGTILPLEQRAVRDLARKRMQLVRSRTTHILAVENITARQQGARISSNQVKRLTAESVDQMPLPADVALAIKANVAVIATLSAQIDLLEKRLQEKVGARAEYGLLTSVPGIGQVLATTILLETGPIERFAAAGNFASMHAASTVCVPATVRRRGKATPRTETSIWLGPSSRRPTLRCATAPRRNGSTNARRRRRTTWWRSRRWRTSWLGRASTF